MRATLPFHDKCLLDAAVQPLRPPRMTHLPMSCPEKSAAVDMAARNADAMRHRNLVETIRHHRDGIVESSRVIARRIDAIGRRNAGQEEDPLQRDIHKSCG